MSEDGFIGWHTIYGVEAEHDTPYMTRLWVGRLRLHIFHRGDADPDPHDHPWDFWTFPLTSYVEEVTLRHYGRPEVVDGEDGPRHEWISVHRHVVPSFRISFRPATHTHRVLGRYEGRAVVSPHGSAPGKIVTIVWRGSQCRRWGFLKYRDGRWCWVYWRDYVFGGGKHGPCEPKPGSRP